MNNSNKWGNKKGGTSFLTTVYTLKTDFGRTHEVTAQLPHKLLYWETISFAKQWKTTAVYDGERLVVVDSVNLS